MKRKVIMVTGDTNEDYHEVVVDPNEDSSCLVEMVQYFTKNGEPGQTVELKILELTEDQFNNMQEM
jgi:hypothetical protein